jgi:hypothetical protein
MSWPRLDTRWWNLSLGAAATTVLGACGPFVILEGETDTAAETATDTEPTDPTTTIECNNGSDCEPGYDCIGNVCMPYDDYYCGGTGGCCDGGCCYDDCCYGECYYNECYADEDCGPLGLCNDGYGYGYCQSAQELMDCGAMPGAVLLELPPASGNEFLSLAFVDANGDPAEDLVVGRVGAAELHLGPGDAPPIPLPVPADASVIDAVSGDFDGDGVSDLLLSTAEGRLLLLAGSGGFSLALDQAVGASLVDLVALQWNGDGTLDVAGISSEGQAMLFSGGEGSFVGDEILPTFRGTFSLVGTNFSPDAYGDLVAADEVSASLFLGSAEGDAQLAANLPGNPHGQRRVLSGGIGGGAADEVVGYTPKSGWLLLELWSDGLDGPQLYSIGGAATLADMGDLDGDGLSDVVVGGDSMITYVHGDSDPGYATLWCQSTYFFGGPVETLAVGDFDGDLRADVAIESAGSVAMLRTQ